MLSDLKNKKLVWLANEHWVDERSITTGHKELDLALGGGFPCDGIIEFKSLLGIGELSLLMQYLNKKQHEGLIAFIQPPSQLSAEALLKENLKLDKLLYIQPNNQTDALWAAEQCLKSGLFSVVLFWIDELHIVQTRRLSLSCEEESVSLICFTSLATSSIPNVKLSLKLTPHPSGMKIKILKHRGKSPSKDPIVYMRSNWSNLYTYQTVKSCSKITNFA